jgi:hypothetical protein
MPALSKHEVSANPDRFKQYGFFNVIDDLAGKDLLKWEAILQSSMSDIMLKRRMNADQRAYQIAIQKSISQENGKNNSKSR